MASDTTDPDPTSRQYEAERPDDTIENPVHGERATFLKRRRDTDDEFVRLEVVAEPGASGPPEHVHENQEEYFQVLSGTLAGRVDGEPITLQPGDEYTVWSGTTHTWGNASDEEELRVLIELRPALQFEEMLETAYGLARDGELTESGFASPFQMAVFAREYWETNRLASPPAPVQKAVTTVLAPIGRRLGYRAYYPEYSPLERRE